MFEQCYLEASAIHKDLRIDQDGFRLFLVEVFGGPTGEDFLACALKGKNVGDLFIACGCCAGDAAAGRAFVEMAIPVVQRVLLDLDCHCFKAQEVLAMVYHRLFAANVNGGPRIKHFKGQGTLRSWVKVVAIRLLLNLLRDRKKEISDSGLAELSCASLPVDLELMKRNGARDFKRALEESLSILSPRERNILRYELVDGLDLSAIAKLYAVNRSTVYRWKTALHERLFRQTRKRMQARLQVDSQEMDSILRLRDGSWEASVKRLILAS